MSEIKKLDSILSFLKEKNQFVTFTDIEKGVNNIKQNDIERITKFLNEKKYIILQSNSCAISMSGVLFIENTPNIFKKHPFYYKKISETIKNIAIFINATTLLTLSWLTFIHNDNQKPEIKVYLSPTKYDSIKNDSLLSEKKTSKYILEDSIIKKIQDSIN